MLKLVLVALVLASWLYWLVALLLALGFFRANSQRGECGFMPPVSVLKPVRGVDAQALENFSSFCRQDYPEYELLFGVADPADPIVPAIEGLRRTFPERDIRLVIAEPEGANRKVGLLQHLEGEARHGMLVVSDSDMRVTPDYLRRVVAPLADESVGLVTCPYLGAAALNLTAGLEALHMGATFLPSILVARKVLGMRFAMGASVTLRRQDLARLGGFAALADYLADDYQLGARIAGLGLKVWLSDYLIACVLGATHFRDQWDREVRWMRCAHVSRTSEYPGLLITFTTPLSVVLALVMGLDPPSLQILATSLMVRWLTAWLISGLTGDQETRRWLIWLPIRDMLSALTWCVGGLSRRIIWRGEAFVLQPDGRMQPAGATESKKRARWLRLLR